ncbi:unnamed protein product [Durusdinium trenchii]|uniref:Uncharacterized protein n=1 Tax=Durusdinium trenchii TaxID=1381693 RepID=A0ABP0Q569_9DINO
MNSIATVVFAAVLGAAVAHPSSWPCNFACMAAKQPGGVFGGMGVANFNNGTDACVITTDIPAAGYTGGQNYTVTVTSTGTFAQKVTCSSGMFGDDDTSNQPTKAMSQTHTWTAPTSGAPASFGAMDRIHPVGKRSTGGSHWGLVKKEISRHGSRGFMFIFHKHKAGFVSNLGAPFWVWGLSSDLYSPRYFNTMCPRHVLAANLIVTRI